LRTLGNATVLEEERGITRGRQSLRRMVALPGSAMHIKIVLVGRYLFQIHALHPSAGPFTAPPLVDPREFVASLQPL